MNISSQVSIPALIGTATAPVTLTANYTDNTSRMAIRFMPNVAITGTYTPGAGSTNAYLQMLIETSEDNVNWSARPIVSPTATENLIYTSAPDTIPGSKTTTASVAVPVSYQDTISAQFIRISVKEHSGGGSAGTVWLQGVAQAA